MKVFFDFLPLVLFFAAYKVSELHSDAAAAFASKYFGVLVSGGVVSAKDAPVLLASLVVVAATLLMVVYMKLRRQHVDKLLWANVIIVTVLGAATIWFHNETFIKWKPTLIYFVMGGAFGLSETFTGTNLLQSLLGKEVTLPREIWRRLALLWCLFFVGMGLLNLYIAYHFSTDTWVNFKLFGSLGLMLVFTVLQGLYIGRHLPPPPAATVSASTPPGHD
jgi:intracellular septation protein